MRISLVFASLVALTGCAGASLAEAYGRPDPYEWTYFDGEVGDVIAALQQSLTQGDLRVESSREEAGGIVITLAPRSGSANVTQLLVQETEEEGFSTRAQIYPIRAPLPRWLEIEVSGRL